MANGQATDAKEPKVDLVDLLRERGVTHGDIVEQATMAQDLQGVMHRSANWNSLNPVVRQTLDMIQLKISRLLEGDPTFAEHWDDLLGYAVKGKEYRIHKGRSQSFAPPKPKESTGK